MTQGRALPIILLAFCASCATPPFDDMINNRYFEVETYADPEAPYLGEWTTATAGGIYSMKIVESGRAITCTKYQAHIEDVKVFLDKGIPTIISENGGLERIKGVEGDFLFTDAYGIEIKYHRGDVPDVCQGAFLALTQ